MNLSRHRPRRIWRITPVAVITATGLVLTAGAAHAATGPQHGGASYGAPPPAANALAFVNATGDRCYRRAPKSGAGTCLRLLHGRASLLPHGQASAGHWPGSRAPVPLQQRLRRAFGSRPSTANRAAAQIPSPPPACDFTSGNSVLNPDRVTSCSDIPWELYTYTTASNGVVTITGSMNLEDLQWNSYQTDSPIWMHGLIIYVDPAPSGTLVNGMSATVSSACSAITNCSVFNYLGTSDGLPVDFTPGSTYVDGWQEVDAGGVASTSGQVDMQDSLGIVLNGQSAAGIPGWGFADKYLSGRCDSVVTLLSGAPDGCVNQQYTPTLTLSLAQYGAAAYMIRWAQQNLSGHWGLQGQGQPVHRLLDKVISSNNREILCDSSFRPDQNISNALAPYSDTDSCDEFPFASSYESGAMDHDTNGNPKPHVTTGANCAQVTVVRTGDTKNESADWNAAAVNGTPAGTEPCVRGHIPNKLNGGVGGAYSYFIQQYRIVDKDPFWISVTP